jgi:hypothetical protein
MLLGIMTMAKKEKNRYGLPREIPRPVRRAVRQRCGFGCVRCGAALFEYEHFNPEFKDATEHCAEGITLLCMQCHGKRTSGQLSKNSVRTANAKPRCLQQGFAREEFDFGSDPIEVIFAGVTISGCKHLIAINDIPILSIKPPESPLEPFLLSGQFSDDTGNVTLKIDDNFWSVHADYWDIECEGAKITIRRRSHKISLVLCLEPPTRVVVERLDMQFQGISLRGDEDCLEFSFDGIRWTKWTGINVSNSPVGIIFDNRPESIEVEH